METEAYDRAINVLNTCCTEDGFLASPTEHDNYRRTWARDGVIIGLAALLTSYHDLASRGEPEKARHYLEAIHKANQLQMNEESCGLPEYVHGELLTAGGTFRQGWSAAAAIIGHHALEGETLFHVEDS